MACHDVVHEIFKTLEKGFQKAQDNADTNKMVEIIQDITKIIKCSDGLKTRQIIDMLKDCSFLLKFWISLEFRSVHDWKFPIFEVFKDYLPDQIHVLENREYLMAFGKNRSFNLGILSDGCPIEEPRLVNIPKCRKILMTNFHTLFQTFDCRVYGCGKSQNFNIGERKNGDVSYIAEPKMIVIEEEIEFLNIAVTDKFSVLVSRNYVYFIGNCTYALSCKGAKIISPNCVQVPLSTKSWEYVDIYANEKSAMLDFHCGNRINECECFGEADTRPFLSTFHHIHEESNQLAAFNKSQTCHVKFNESFPNVELSVVLIHNEMYYQPANTKNDTLLQFIVNLKRVNDAKPIGFFINATKNEIIVQFAKGIIAKGTLEFLKLQSDEFKAVKKDKGILDNMVGYHLFAVLTEIPGTFGSTMFCSSPDLTNVIIQFGQNDESVKRMNFDDYLTDDEEKYSQQRISALLQKYRHSCDLKNDITTSYICEKLELLEKEAGRRIMEFKISDLEELCVLLNFIQIMMSDGIDCFHLKRNAGVFGWEVDSVDFVIEQVKVMEEQYAKFDDFLSRSLDFEFAQDHEKQKLAIRRINEARNNNCLNDIEMRRPRDVRLMLKVITATNAIKCRFEVVQNDSEVLTESESSTIELQFSRRKLLFCQKQVLQMLDLYIQIIMDRMDNELELQYLSKFPTRKFRSENIIEIINNRIDDGDLDEFDIPMDMIIRSSDKNVRESFNSLLFSMIYPKAVEFIENDRVELDGNDKLFHHLFNRARFADELTSARRREFVADGTSPEDVVSFLTNDGKRVDIQRYIVIAHSRQISAMQRFTYTQYGFESSSSPAKLEIKTDFDTKTVRDALTALMDIRTLFHRRMNELVEILFFFDYFMMLEAVQDTIDVIFLTATPHSVPYLLNLFESFGEETMKRFVKYPYFLLQTKLELTHELIFEFCEKSSRTFRWKNKTSETDGNEEEFIKLDGKEFNERFAGKFAENNLVKQKRSRNNSSRNNSISEYSSPRQARLKTPSICESSPRAVTEPKNISNPSFDQSPQFNTSLKSPSGSPAKNENSATSPIAISQSPSSVDFPESPNFSLCTPLGKHRTGGRFIPKGTRFKKANDILQSPEHVNPWSKNITSPNSDKPVFERMSPLKLEDVMKEEEKMSKRRKGEMKKIRHLPHIEMEDQAVIEIGRVFQQQFESEAKITVELLDEQNNGVENEPVWGIMPGLLRR